MEPASPDAAWLPAADLGIIRDAENVWMRSRGMHAMDAPHSTEPRSKAYKVVGAENAAVNIKLVTEKKQAVLEHTVSQLLDFGARCVLLVK